MISTTKSTVNLTYSNLPSAADDTQPTKSIGTVKTGELVKPAAARA